MVRNYRVELTSCDESGNREERRKREGAGRRNCLAKSTSVESGGQEVVWTEEISAEEYAVPAQVAACGVGTG